MTTEYTAQKPAPARAKFSLRFSARDLMTTAIFTVLLIVVTYAIGMLGIISPVAWLLTVPLDALASGIVVMLFLARVRHAGMMLLLTAVVAIFFVVSGTTPLAALGIIVLGLIAELILWVGRYRSRWAAVWAYTVFGLSLFAPFLPLLIDRESYFASSVWQDMGDDYRAASDTLLAAPVIGIMAGVVVLASFLGGLLGSAVVRKHFVRAGLA